MSSPQFSPWPGCRGPWYFFLDDSVDAVSQNPRFREGRDPERHKSRLWSPVELGSSSGSVASPWTTPCAAGVAFGSLGLAGPGTSWHRHASTCVHELGGVFKYLWCPGLAQAWRPSVGPSEPHGPELHVLGVGGRLSANKKGLKRVSDNSEAGGGRAGPGGLGKARLMGARRGGGAVGPRGRNWAGL